MLYTIALVLLALWLIGWLGLKLLGPFSTSSSSWP